jgi:branched-chain amino acid transport system permease protein
LIGVGFLLIVLFSPDGVLGLWARWRERLIRPNGDLRTRHGGAS